MKSENPWKLWKQTDEFLETNKQIPTRWWLHDNRKTDEFEAEIDEIHLADENELKLTKYLDDDKPMKTNEFSGIYGPLRSLLNEVLFQMISIPWAL